MNAYRIHWYTAPKVWPHDLNIQPGRTLGMDMFTSTEQGRGQRQSTLKTRNLFHCTDCLKYPWLAVHLNLTIIHSDIYFIEYPTQRSNKFHWYINFYYELKSHKVFISVLILLSYNGIILTWFNLDEMLGMQTKALTMPRYLNYTL